MIVVNEKYCPNCFQPQTTGRACPNCGFAEGQRLPIALPIGALLHDKYLVGRVLGCGGFGITYLAKDIISEKYCAIKEYFPTEIVVRSQGFTVRPSGKASSLFMQDGIDRFVSEARALARFRDCPNIVQIYEAFLENGTAYFVMEYLDGVNCKALLRNLKGKMPLSYSLEILCSILNLLIVVHSQNLLHRDISLENIFVVKDGTVKLIDFGSARFFGGEQSRNLTVVLKPGYAPPEQYSSGGAQGPWTDIYSLAASFYHMVSGQLIPDAPERLEGHPLPRLDALEPTVSRQVAGAIDKALALNYRHRFATMVEFADALGLRQKQDQRPAQKPAQNPEADQSQPKALPKPQPQQKQPQQKQPHLKQPPQQKQPQAKPFRPSQKSKPPIVAPTVSPIVASKPASPDKPLERPPQKANEPSPASTPHKANEPAPASTPKPYVALLSGPYQGKVWGLPSDVEIIIGRAPDCNVIIKSEDISRRHCSLRFDSKTQGFYLHDLSMNGTFYTDDKRIPAEGASLSPGSEFYLAHPQMRVRIGLE